MCTQFSERLYRPRVKRITDRLTVESGLTYTYLSSDIKESSNNHCYSGKRLPKCVYLPIHVGRYEDALRHMSSRGMFFGFFHVLVVAIAILTGTQFYNGTPDLAIPKSIASPTADNNKTEEKNKKNDNSYEAIAPTPRKTATYKTTLASYYEAPSDEVPSVDNKRDEEKTPADKIFPSL